MALSSLPMKINVGTLMRLRRYAVILTRIIVGLTFVVAGWAKAIDPWGFVIKMGEYFSAWGLAIPHEPVVAACVGVACVEFCTGVMVLVGAFKRWAVWTAAAFMVFMLPLTAYIAIANPVSDCGCFGDFIVISNWATFAKNILLSALIVYLLFRNRTVRGLYPAPIQWMIMALSVAFPLYLAVVGYNVQPMVDFRPFKTGCIVFNPSGEIADVKYIYEKDGQERVFNLDELPDSTWTYVHAVVDDSTAESSIGVYDDDGEDIAPILSETMGDRLYLVVAQPDVQFLSRSRFVNELADYGGRHDSPMCAIVGVDGDTLESWKNLVRPRFPVYTAEDTSLKMLARGTAALVFVRDGVILWKRSLASVDMSVLQKKIEGNVLDTIQPIDDGRHHLWVCAIYLVLMIAVYLLGQSPKLLPNRKK